MDKPCNNCVYKNSGQCSCGQLDKYELYIETYNQALEDFAQEILNYKPQDEEYRSFKDVVNEVKEQIRK